jgi:hypothetical protein
VGQNSIVSWLGVVASVIVLSTSRPDGAQGNAPTGERGTGRYVVIGCIKSTAADSSGFSITDYRRGPVDTTFVLDGKDARLKPWVNDTVEIHGTLTPTSPGSGASTPMKLTVETLFVISRGCKPSSVDGK